MSIGIVFFRFKHQKGFDRIEFSGSEISVAELKLKIIEKLVLVEKHAHASAIQLHRPSADRDDTNAVGSKYEYDSEIIPANTSVIIIRVPNKVTGNRITVTASEFFPQVTAEQGVDPFALKQSIIADEIDQVKKVPPVLICSVCRFFMTSTNHAPVVLHCCGGTVCMACAKGAGSECPLEKISTSEDLVRFSLHRSLGRLVNVVVLNRAHFAFDEGVLFDEDFSKLSSEQHPTTEAGSGEAPEVVDLEEPDIVDVDKPLTAKELEQIERRERRKRKAAELILKKEGKAIKGELTESEIARIFKEEIKREEGSGFLKGELGEEDFSTARFRGPVIVELPRLLTAEEFACWKSQ